MTSSRPASARRFSAARIVSLLVLSGCAAEVPTAPPVQEPTFAKGGGNGPTVRAANPDTGLRNTTIDVRVLGSGFDNGSKATWALAGDTANATTRITTNSTRFVKSGELVANITIAADAPLALFDIVVVAAGGKKGIGIEMFAVKDSDRTDPYSAQFDDGAGYLLRSDNGAAYVDGSPDFAGSCVGSSVFPGGLYQLRTVAATGACKAVQRPGWRWFTFDLGSGNTLDLDQDGVAEPIESAPGRLMAEDTFAQGATSTFVRIFVFVVNPDGSTEWDAKFDVRYQANVVITTLSDGGRILEASPGNAAADIWAVSGGPRRGPPNPRPPDATVQLPFKLTLTPMQ